MRIAMNLRWTWDPKAVDLFRWVDPVAWDRSGHDPVRMLGQVGRGRFEELAEDGPFVAFLADAIEDLDSYLREPRWFQARKPRPAVRCVAYFCMEFGVGEALPIYSGGLGVLAGDHLKASSDLGLPMVGIGLLYREGYFRQELNADGWQQERYPDLDPYSSPLTLLTNGSGQPVKVTVDLAGTPCAIQMWRADVGRVPLLLLDTDVDDNPDELRTVTDRLYAGDAEHRLRQEIVLGIGGIRALEAAGFDADVFHSNEGHAGFLGLERIRRCIEANDLTFAEALEAVRASTIFTTHTPVPAGIDVFPVELMRPYFETLAKQCGVTFEELMELGRPPSGDGETFNMAVMGLRLAARSNAVSALHGRVSRAMFASLWPDVPEEEVPIGSVTNGVHTPTWIGPEMAEIFTRRLGPGWAEAGGVRWERISDVPDAELWRVRERARERLVYFVRERLRRQLQARGAADTEIAWTDEVFDPGVLTIGFARRFAMYKRGNLILSDPERLRRLLLGTLPVQIVIAGKAHPHDDGGKEMIRQIVHFSSDPEVRTRIAFIEDYDMEVARVLQQGADVWLNNPRRPMEACGTSGMKAALNGALNCSTLDGWWDECYDGSNGWAIGTRDTYEDLDYQDRVDVNALYDLLERDIVPRFYDRSEGPVPRRWIERMKSSIGGLGHFVTADRMVRDYIADLYEPAARQGAAMAEQGFGRARALAAWKARVRAAWTEVAVLEVDGDTGPAGVGEQRTVSARVALGSLGPEDVSVEVLHGRVGPNDELQDPVPVRMTPSGQDGAVWTFVGSFATDDPGLHGYAVRVTPAHPDLSGEMDLGLVTWAV